jgi:hypothetical protein
VTLTSAATGLSTISGSWNGIIATAEGDASAFAYAADVYKRWVDARLTLTPFHDDNSIAEPHDVTAKLEFDYGDGASFVAAPDGETINLSTDFGYFDAAMTLQSTSCLTGGGTGECTVTMYSDLAGTANITANWTGSITTAEGSTTATADPATATKTWHEGSLTWYKVDDDGEYLGGAEFEVCNTYDRNGVEIIDGCFPVIDNLAPDTDPQDGVFVLLHLPLGTWTIQETVAPEGYIGDLDRIETVVLTIAMPDGEVSEPWVNRRAGRITHTNVTCEIFNSGAVDSPPSGTEYLLDAVEYSTKGNPSVINQVNPGVFFYWTKFLAEGTAFTVNINQETVVGSFQLIGIHNENQVQLWDGDTCEALNANYTLTDGAGGIAELEVLGVTDGQPLIISVKYDPGSLKGLTPPGGPVRYKYSTLVEGILVDTNSNGLWLIKKGDPIPD